MLFFEFDCLSHSESEAATQFGGAFVLCWIDGRERSDAEALARRVIRHEGWKVILLNESYPITRDDYADGHSAMGLARFDQAAENGDCFQFETYPIGTVDDDSD